jgi:hypothetical protein
MSRVVWFAAGAGVGVYAMTRARRAAEVLTPEGLADRLAGLSLGVRLFRDLRERLGLALHGTPAGLSGSDVVTATSPPDRSATTREGND